MTTAETSSKELVAKKVAKISKKSIVVEMISTKKGATIEAMAQSIVDKGIDADFEKNKRVVRLWLCKIGFPVEKLEGNLYHKKA